ncbi:MAG TPA: hypothetical protein VE954_36910 [Oligoflexus sp.]|uniref:hypothetical protein n=1 Tax=Oligoflexus sp. TaxID=1971216 RepID=UPI002D69FD67|nr:hypothetical protein [Oligoflexus sp.]HYX38719.1 hypothetical protein [Oligoflexus sp.]
MQHVRKRQGREVKSHEGTTWTTNSDLFMSIAIIFLIMFVFALLSSGATQLSVQQEKMDAQKYLLGKIPESDKVKTVQEMDDVAKDIQQMAEKREMIKTSLTQLAQLAQSIEGREDSIKKLYDRQNKNQALLKQSQEIIALKEKVILEKDQQITATQIQMKQMEKSLSLNKKDLQSLDTSLADLQAQSQSSQTELSQAKTALTAKTTEIAKLQQTMQTTTAQSETLKKQLGTVEKSLAEAKTQSNQYQTMSADLQKQVEQNRVESQALTEAKQNVEQKLQKMQKDNQGLSDELAKLRQENQNLKKDNGQLAASNSELNASLKSSQSANEGLKSQLSKAGDQIAALEGQVKGLGQENGQLQAANGQLGEALKKGQGESEGLKSQLGAMGEKLGGLEGQVKGLGKENGQLKDANGQLGEALKKGQGANEGLQAQLAQQGKALADSKKQTENLQDALKDIKQKFAAVQSDNNGNKKLADDLSRRLAVLAQDHDQLQKESSELGKKLNNLGQDHQNVSQKLSQAEKARVVCEDEKSSTKDQQKKLAMAVHDQEKKLGDAASTLAEARKAVQTMGNERKRIAGSIANNLKSSGVEVDINPETGNITLRMDESFYFKNNSYELRDEAKQKIAQIMPIYAQSLLGTPSIANRIEKILVTGFASPKFNKNYVDPISAVGEPYEYNLDLSLSRAREIVAYMFGTGISNYPYKDQMRGIVSVSGMGLMNPILLDKNSICHKDPTARSRLEECGCETYDCKKSRRVEIQFVLRNQKDTERQLQIISDKLNERGANHVSH